MVCKEKAVRVQRLFASVGIFYSLVRNAGKGKVKAERTKYLLQDYSGFPGIKTTKRLA